MHRCRSTFSLQLESSPSLKQQGREASADPLEWATFAALPPNTVGWHIALPYMPSPFQLDSDFQGRLDSRVAAPRLLELDSHSHMPGNLRDAVTILSGPAMGQNHGRAESRGRAQSCPWALTEVSAIEKFHFSP